MKTFTPMTFLLALALTVTTAAQVPRLAGFEKLRVKNQEMPGYPQELVQVGVRDGQVCIAFSVDTTGKVDDALAVAYTRREFAQVALAAVRRWTFEPARLGGEPIATATEVTFNFEVQGTVVVSMTAGEAFATWIGQLHLVDESFYPRSLRELDRIPTPLLAPSPYFPATLAQRGHVGEVAVNFYIDETGAVRLPAVESGSDPDLAGLAIVAIQKWKFEPPVCRGRKVLTKTSQVFRFRPDSAPVARSMNKT